MQIYLEGFKARAPFRWQRELPAVWQRELPAVWLQGQSPFRRQRELAAPVSCMPYVKGQASAKMATSIHVLSEVRYDRQ